VRLEQLPIILVALVVAAIAAYLLTPLAMRFARWSRAIDEPDAGRRIHVRPIPRAGGIAVVIAFVAVGLLTMLLTARPESPGAGPFPFTYIWAGDRMFRDELLALLAGTALAAVFGFVDDRWQIRARWQLIFQLVLAGFAIYFGVTILSINNPLDFLGGDLEVPFRFATVADPVTPASALITILWIVGMINSINFIDGLDGLSAGVALIAALTLGLISLSDDFGAYQPMVALLCAALAGALAGFLPWNFYPAKVFIGTTGVMAVGYALAVLSILGSAKIAVALLVLGVPIIDTFWIILRRLFHGRSPFTPDRGHFHHRLLDRGLTHKGAVLLIYAICAVLAVLSLILAGGSGPLYAFMAVVVGSGLLLLLVTFRSGTEEALEASSYPDPPAEPLAARTAPDGRAPEGGSATEDATERRQDAEAPPDAVHDGPRP
jgi:UDP-GlcNAc:undecaprenyl-phosphate/decaprenyl-phosphate GlcNAc-1-phosphate transferase